MSLFNRFQSIFRGNRVNVRERFEILRWGISGTMSKFYVARDRKTDDIVGLKIADREKVTAFETRFKGLQKPSEGEIASKLHHPFVVETYEYGLTTDGVQYIVMELLKGPGLHQLLKARDPTIEGRRLELIRQMAEAVGYVHSEGFIHRDVCPRNFIHDTDTGKLKLIDFGLSLPARKPFMQPGNRTGTPLYMAPEVIRRRWTDQRLDIFAMGISAYQICTFELPWPITEITGQAALAHDTQEPCDIRQLYPALNEQLARAIMRCIQPNPDDRPQTVERFLRSIRGVKSDEE
ncbi:MAG: serine/threonine-protein kinase [Pirellulaceae bacterium]